MLNRYEKERLKSSKQLILTKNQTFIYKKKTFIIKTKNSLISRLKVLIVAYGLANMYHYNFIINWVPDKFCSCNLFDLIDFGKKCFVVNEDIIKKNLEKFSFKYYEKIDKDNINLILNDFENNRNIFIEANDIIKLEYSEKFYSDFFNTLKFSRNVNLVIDSFKNKNNNGILLNFNDYSVSNNFYYNFINNILGQDYSNKLFITSFNNINIEKINYFYDSDYIDFLKNNKSDIKLNSIQLVFVKIMLLSKCNKFYCFNECIVSKFINDIRKCYHNNEKYNQINIKKDKNYFIYNEFDEKIEEGNSILLTCWNNNKYLKKQISKLLKFDDINEIVVIDWNSDEDVTVTLNEYRDGRLKIYRIVIQNDWLPTKAYNIGVKLCKFTNIYKLNCEVIPSPNFISNNKLTENVFYYGKTQMKNNVIEGCLFCKRENIIKCNFWNENLNVYYDDLELYDRLSKFLEKKVIDDKQFNLLLEYKKRKIYSNLFTKFDIDHLLHEDKIKFYQKMCYLGFLNWDIDNKTSTFKKLDDNKLVLDNDYSKKLLFCNYENYMNNVTTYLKSDIKLFNNYNILQENFNFTDHKYVTKFNYEPDKLVNIVISLYDETNKKRFDELKCVLQMNIRNPNIEKIIVLYEKKLGLWDKILLNKKVDIFIVTKRPTFNDYFKICNDNYVDSICCICNSDIIFSYDINFLPNVDHKKAITLTRYNVNNIKVSEDNFEIDYDYMRNHMSQDVWIFKSPIKLLKVDILLGSFTCDSFINSQIITSGYKYENLSNVIRVFHYQDNLSESQMKNYEEIDWASIYDNYLKEIRKYGIRLSVCGINFDGSYFYPTGESNCKNKTEIYLSSHNLTINKCFGCNDCKWEEFFPNLRCLLESDKIYSEENPYIITFDVMTKFKAIEFASNELINIYKILDKDKNEVKFSFNEAIIFDEIVYTNKFYIYYNNLLELKITKDNFIRYNDFGIIISGITKNSESYIKKLYKNLSYFKLFFKECKIFVYENDSSDNTVKELEKYFSKNEYKSEKIITECKYRFHYSIMAIARDKCRNYINSLCDNEFKFVLLVDTDLRIDLKMYDIQFSLINKDNYDVQFANGVYGDNNYYWDTFATRTENRNIPFFLDNESDGVNRYWKEVCNIPDVQKPIEEDFKKVVSGFGGMGLYKKHCFKLSNYNPDVEDCEHVPFHEKLFKLGKKLVINKRFIKRYSEEETIGGYYSKYNYQGKLK